MTRFCLAEPGGTHRRRGPRCCRALFAAEPGLVAGILASGNARANELADATIRDVRELMGMVHV